MLFRASVLSLALFAAPISTAAWQESQAPAGSEAAALADGWARLGRGDAAGASRAAVQVLELDPLSVAAAALAVEAELTRGAAAAGLTAYEKWLGSRRLDDGYVLRRIARALLRESRTKQPNATARLEALRALAADGDGDAASALEKAAVSGSFGETRALAMNGDERGINILIARLASAPVKGPIIEALAESGSRLPVPQLTALLSDPSDVTRAQAADALGRLGATEATPQLRPLLQDQVFTVRLKAAGALFRLSDSGGLTLLNELAGSEHAAIRMAAARELAAQPDAAWQSLVRSLTSDPDPSVRLDAARLIAPYDPVLARQILDDLMRDSNVAVREAASEVLVERVAGDFATLRPLLRSADVLVRVRAAARILELSR